MREFCEFLIFDRHLTALLGFPFHDESEVARHDQR
jgi:hypothetical protein